MLTVCCGRNWAEAIGTGERCLPGDPDDCGDGGKAAEARLSYPKGRLLPAILSSDPDPKICPNLDPDTGPNMGQNQSLIKQLPVHYQFLKKKKIFNKFILIKTFSLTIPAVSLKICHMKKL